MPSDGLVKRHYPYLGDTQLNLDNFINMAQNITIYINKNSQLDLIDNFAEIY